MSPYKLLFFIPVIAFFVFACQEEPLEIELIEEGEKAAPPLADQLIDYFPLAVGQYWVFQGQYTNLETGEITPIGKFDSIYIARDTLIGRHQYFNIEGKRFGIALNTLVRTSGPDLLDHMNQLLFSLEQYNDTLPLPSHLLLEEAAFSETILHEGEQQQTSLGTFESIVMDQIHHLDSEQNTYLGESVIYESNFFGKNIGPIRFTRLLPHHQIFIEMELVRSSLF